MLQNLEAALYTLTQGSFYDLQDKKQILQLSLALQALVVFCFSISSFLVSSTANAGFNVVLNAFLNVGYVGGGYYGLEVKTSLAIGFLMGVTLMMGVMDLMTAVYWGQLSHCSKISSDAIDQYSCQNRTTYKAVCAFAVMMFILKVCFFGAIVHWRRDIVDETDSYDNVLQFRSSSSDDVSMGDNLYEVGIHSKKESWDSHHINTNENSASAHSVQESGIIEEESFSL